VLPAIGVTSLSLRSEATVDMPTFAARARSWIDHRSAAARHSHLSRRNHAERNTLTLPRNTSHSEPPRAALFMTGEPWTAPTRSSGCPATLGEVVGKIDGLGARSTGWRAIEFKSGDEIIHANCRNIKHADQHRRPGVERECAPAEQTADLQAGMQYATSLFDGAW